MIRRMMSLVGVATVLALCAPSPALAADEIGLSNDGSAWSSSLASPLFDSKARWVPGDAKTVSFFVRNQGPSSALMALEAHITDNGALLENEDIILQARVVGDEWISLENGITSHTLTEQSTARGGTREIEISAIFNPTSTNESKAKQLELNVVITLVDALDDADGNGSSDEDGAFLPVTGTTMMKEQWLLIGAILVVVGLTTTARRRKREGVRIDV